MTMMKLNRKIFENDEFFYFVFVEFVKNCIFLYYIRNTVFQAHKNLRKI